MSAAHMEHFIVGRKLDALPKSAMQFYNSDLQVRSYTGLWLRRHTLQQEDESAAKALESMS